MKLFYVCLIALLPFFSGCSTVRDFFVENAGPEKIADAVDFYCDELPANEREKNREQINAQTSPGNSIEITCANDPE